MRWGARTLACSIRYLAGGTHATITRGTTIYVYIQRSDLPHQCLHIVAMVPCPVCRLGEINMCTAWIVQVDPYLNVVKGRGGALLREKVGAVSQQPSLLAVQSHT